MRAVTGGKVPGGKNIYGFSLGIMMLQSRFPRIPGEMGNAWTWNFPVLYKVVQGASPQRVVQEQDPALLEPFISTANELVSEGVKAITTTCGFLAMFQKELAAKIEVPVFTSTLMMMPLIYSMLKPGQKVGILTVNSATLKPKHFESVGASHVPYALGGMETAEKGHFYHTFIDNQLELDIDLARSEIREVSAKLVKKNPDIGAIILECTNMPPYSEDVREVTGLPVFDIVTFVKFVHNALVKPDIRGIM